MGILKTSKKQTKPNYENIEEIVKALNNRKTTVDNVMSGLQDIIYKFQDSREEFYIKEIQEKMQNGEEDPEDFDLNLSAERIQQQILNDTKTFVETYVTKAEDDILDAINDKRVKKQPAHAFLILLSKMKKAFSDIE